MLIVRARMFSGNAVIRLEESWGFLKNSKDHREAFRNNEDRPGEGLWRSSEDAWGLLGRLGGSLEILRGFMGSPKLEILSFLQPLWRSSEGAWGLL